MIMTSWRRKRTGPDDKRWRPEVHILTWKKDALVIRGDFDRIPMIVNNEFIEYSHRHGDEIRRLWLQGVDITGKAPGVSVNAVFNAIRQAWGSILECPYKHGSPNEVKINVPGILDNVKDETMTGLSHFIDFKF